jgi:hypothetical protein
MNLVKTDHAGYMMQSRGLIENTNEIEYQRYIRQRDAMKNKDTQIEEMVGRINMLEDMLSKILNKMDSK